MRKTILITGGTGLIGLELVRHFLTLDYLVVITTRDKDRFNNKVKSANDQDYSNLDIIEINFEHEGYLNKLNNDLALKNINPDILVNNVRNIDNLKINANGEVSEEKWINEFKMSAIIPYELSNMLANTEDSKLSSIINIGSIYGVVAPNSQLYDNFESQSPIHYGVCKAAMSHLSKELSVRLADKMIRVNTISFGGVEGRADSNFIKRYSQLCPQRKMLNIDEVGGVVEFLADNSKSSAITGQNIIVDGGWSVW